MLCLLAGLPWVGRWVAFGRGSLHGRTQGPQLCILEQIARPADWIDIGHVILPALRQRHNVIERDAIALEDSAAVTAVLADRRKDQGLELPQGGVTLSMHTASTLAHPSQALMLAGQLRVAIAPQTICGAKLVGVPLLPRAVIGVDLLFVLAVPGSLPLLATIRMSLAITGSGGAYLVAIFGRPSALVFKLLGASLGVALDKRGGGF